MENQLFEKKNELLEMSERLPREIKIKAEREKKTEVIHKGFLYHNTKKVLGEHFKAFRGLVKNELDMKGVDNQFESEHKKEIKKQRGYEIGH